MSTLHCINNRHTRFKTFVANRLAIIHDVTTAEQWRHVPSEFNPADAATRGIWPHEQAKLQFWLNGPTFLHSTDDSMFPAPSIPQHNSDMSNEVKATACTTTVDNKSGLETLMERCSSWHKMQRLFAWLLRFKQFCCVEYLHHDREVNKTDITLPELTTAKHEILKRVQSQTYAEELKCVQKSDGKGMKTNKLIKLSPFIENELLRVGGRLQNSELGHHRTHPIILPEKHHVTNLIIRQYHETYEHVGTQQVLSLIRKDYWITKGVSAVKRVIGDCFRCKRLYKTPCEQMMAPLPKERVTADKPPFTYMACDMFGPMFVKYGRGQSKQ